ncbi:MAG: helix-turn-helix domain-containing protein [Solirubrobacteraceae bacterium]
MAEIGATLRETRMRARVDVSEIEAQTKIRAKYLRALENEEWDLLPGPTFVRSFLRTYAQALGLDDKALVDEYRRVYEQPSEVELQPAVMASPARRARSASVTRRPSRGYTIALGVVGLLIVLLVVGLLSEKKGGTSPKPQSNANAARASTSSRHHRSSSPNAGTPASGTSTAGGGTRVALSLKPSAPVWVCLIGDGTRKAIPGITLQPSYTPVTYHAGRFTVTLGNDAVTMYVNGRAESVPTTSNSIGYSITSSGRHLLSSTQQPTCK